MTAHPGTISYRVYHAPEFEEVNLAFPALLRDGAGKHNVVLERYFHDVYSMFLHRLTSLAMGEQVAQDEVKKLHALLDELVKVKDLISESGKAL